LLAIAASFRLASFWFIAAIRRISAKEKRRIVLCVILNITTTILMHVMDTADCLPFPLVAKCLTL